MPIKRLPPTSTVRNLPVDLAKPKFNPAFNPTAQQNDIYSAVSQTKSHIIVDALAGTGKTSTMIQSLFNLHPDLWPHVWLCAFNKTIANELKSKVPAGVRSSTLHGFCHHLLASYVPGLDVDPYMTGRLTKLYYAKDLKAFVPWKILKTVESLVDLVRCNMLTPSRETFNYLVENYGLDPGKYERASFETAYRILTEYHFVHDYKDLGYQFPTIDFGDMAYQVAKQNLLPKQPLEFMLIDEAQDLDTAQQRVVINVPNRVMAVGDENQAIYGFRGADTTSIPNLIDALKGNRNVLRYPLTVSFRCPLLHVELAKALVPSFQAMDAAPLGTLQSITPYSFQENPPKPPALILCRVNAPLISLCYDLILAGIPARIQGKDIGRDLAGFVRHLAGVHRIKPVENTPVPMLLGALAQYRLRETERIMLLSRGSEQKLETLIDRCTCIEHLSEGCSNAGELLTRISNVFTDVEPGQTLSDKFVLLSTIHKAKGLESPNVYIINPEKMPLPYAVHPWEVREERNVIWVSITRSSNSLTFVGPPPAPIAGAFYKIMERVEQNYYKPYDNLLKAHHEQLPKETRNEDPDKASTAIPYPECYSDPETETPQTEETPASGKQGGQAGIPPVGVPASPLAEGALSDPGLQKQTQPRPRTPKRVLQSVPRPAKSQAKNRSTKGSPRPPKGKAKSRPGRGKVKPEAKPEPKPKHKPPKPKRSH
jgi:DNA helicase-2/ATP-dependent DNA helicase PcrA